MTVLLQSRPFKFLKSLPILLMVVVAMNQLRLVAVEHMVPWSGGGFGMFASVDTPGSRHLHVFLEHNSVRREVVFPAALHREVRRALVLPTRERLQQLADAAFAEQADSMIAWNEVVVEVWRTRLDPQSLLPQADLVRQQRFQAARQ